MQPPYNHPPTDGGRLTDAQLAAYQAAQAFLDGRYELGLAFGRLAVQAHRFESSGTVHVPKPVHDPRPLEHDDALLFRRFESDALDKRTAVYPVPPDFTPAAPTGNGSHDLAAIAEELRLQNAAPPLALVTTPAAAGETGRILRTTRCDSTVLLDRVPGPCSKVLFWNEYSDPTRAGWLHLDQTDDHVPLPRSKP